MAPKKRSKMMISPAISFIFDFLSFEFLVWGVGGQVKG